MMKAHYSLVLWSVLAMANTKTPVVSTYKTKMVNLLTSEFDRSPASGKDTDHLNVFFELIQEKSIGENSFNIVKRPGVELYISAVGPSGIRSMYFNSDFQKLYYVVEDDLHVWDVVTNTSSIIIPAVFGTTVGDVGFTDYLYDNGTQVVIFTDGTTLNQIDSANTLTVCADADLPVPHQPYPVFLDGYLFLLKSETSDLYNSNLNDPMLWTAGDFITSEIQPDQATRPIKVNNYIVVFGTDSIEYFWDAGISTGSPLQRNDTPVKYNGFLGAYAQWGNKAYFVGNNVQGQPDVFILEDLKMEPIGDVTVSRYLSSLTVPYSSYRGSIVGIAGHVFYILAAGTLTYVYDLTTKLWCRWAYQQDTDFPMLAAVNTKTASTYRSFFCLEGTTIYKFSNAVGDDNLVDFTCSGQTENQMFESYNQKTMNRLTVWADKPTSSLLMNLQYTDDDYQTYSTAQTVDLFQERPSINRLGRFRRRAFKWSYTGDLPLRIKGLEVLINLGQN